jgi:hypothetical protein
MADQITPSTDSSQLMSALSVDMSGPLSYQNLTKKHNELNKQLTELETSTADLQTTRDLEAAKARKKSIDDANTKYEASIAEQQKKLDSFGDVKFQPTQDNLTDIAGLFSAVGIIGSMIGGKGKNASLSALSAMDGMLSGWSQGRADLFKKEKITFDEKLNVIKTEKDAIIQQMKIIAEEYTHDKEKAEQNFQVLLAEKGGPIMRNIAMQKGFKGALDYVDNVLGKAVDNAVQHSYRMSEKQVAGGGKAEKDILPLVQGVRATNNLLQQLQDPDVQVGLKAKVAPLFEKIKSLKSNTDFETAVNNTLTGTDKTTLFLKDALLETYAIERAAKGGQRLTVQDVKMIGPVLDPTNYTPQAYTELIDRRRKDLYNRLQDMGLSQEAISKRAAEHPYTTYTGSKSAEGDKRSVSSTELKEYATKHQMDEVSAKSFLQSQGYTVE